MRFYMPESIKELTHLPNGVSIYTIVVGKMLNSANDLLNLKLRKESDQERYYFALLDHNLIAHFMNEAGVSLARGLEGKRVMGIEDKLNEQNEDLIGLTAISLN